jgi:hypothetical protein
VYSIIYSSGFGIATPSLRPSTRRSSCDTQWPTSSAVRAVRALQLALSSEAAARLQYWGLVALGFVLCSRPTAVRLLERDDIDVQLHDIAMQMRTLKDSETSTVARVAFRIPIQAVPGPTHDPIYRLLARLVAATSLVAPQLFPKATASSIHAAIHQLVIGETQTNGSKYNPRSLRSGGISVAYAKGVGIPAIVWLYNHASTTTVHMYYLDALLPASEACCTFFRRFLAADNASRGGGSA